MKKTTMMLMVAVIGILFVGNGIGLAEGVIEFGMGMMSGSKTLYSQEKADLLPLMSFGYWSEPGEVSVGIKLNMFYSGTVESTSDVTGSGELGIKYFPTKGRGLYFGLLGGGTFPIGDSNKSTWYVGHEVGIKLFAKQIEYVDDILEKGSIVEDLASLWLVGGFKKKAVYIAFVINLY